MFSIIGGRDPLSRSGFGGVVRAVRSKTKISCGFHVGFARAKWSKIMVLCTQLNPVFSALSGIWAWCASGSVLECPIDLPSRLVIR